MNEKNTLVGISIEVLDEAKIHIVKHKERYEHLTDLVTRAVKRQIEEDQNAADTTTTTQQ